MLNNDKEKLWQLPDLHRIQIQDGYRLPRGQMYHHYRRTGREVATQRRTQRTDHHMG